MYLKCKFSLFIRLTLLCFNHNFVSCTSAGQKKIETTIFTCIFWNVKWKKTRLMGGIIAWNQLWFIEACIYETFIDIKFYRVAVFEVLLLKLVWNFYFQSIEIIQFRFLALIEMLFLLSAATHPSSTMKSFLKCRLCPKRQMFPIIIKKLTRFST